MGRCTDCGAELHPGARFCASCGSAVDRSCGSCGAELPAGARFCPSCGTPVADAPGSEVALGPGEERKVISVLFADLVGFTSHTEAHDAEDVKQRLTEYHRRMREFVERHGGHVEKLMGDGVFAVFGVPAAHEDDPERAVRAALRFQQEQSEGEGELAVRIAVTTGEAIVQLDRSDQDREGIIGDVVNTASRLEAHAPPGGVLVDERTYLATSKHFAYRPGEPVDLRGKEGVTPVWHAESATARYGVDVDTDTSTPFVGRAHELALIERSFERALADRSLQLVTVSGEPGSGKSRLVEEFRKVVDARPDLVWWRQGRCLPYGDGITFWALGEVVKAQSGILDSDHPGEARTKLVDAVTALIPDRSAAEWVTNCLVPLAGVGPTPPGVERDELFRGWLRFLDALAARRPLVMVIEDLHWADDALVEFLGFLIRRSVDSPILLIASARSELFASHPDWGAGLRNATSVSLAPLADADAAALLGALLPGRLMDAEAQERLLERCGGNPLHLLEFVRLATEQGLIDRIGDGTIPMPDTVQAVVAARLDLLPPDGKAVLQSAAVVGKVFWDGALVFALPLQRSDVRAALEAMAERDLIRPVRQSSMAGEEEWAFTHSVIRDVAYGQLPRAERRVRHEAVARWMEAVAGERAVDVAEVLAHHYAAAMEGVDEASSELRERAYSALMAAGRRADSFEPRRAADYYEQAAAVASSDSGRGHALLRKGWTFVDIETTTAAALGAEEAFRAAGLPEREAEAIQQLATAHWWDGRGAEARRLEDRAVELVRDLPDSLAKANVLLGFTRREIIRGELDEARGWFELARSSVDAFGDADARIDELLNEGHLIAEADQDPAGLEVLDRARRMAADRGMTQKFMTATNNLETLRFFAEGATRPLAGITGAIELADERGYGSGGLWSRGTRMEFLFPMGRWDALLADADRILELADQHGGEQSANMTRFFQTAVGFYRGADSGFDTTVETFERALEQGDPQVVGPTAGLLVAIGAASGRHGPARRAADELVAIGPQHYRDSALLRAAPWMSTIGRLDVLETLVSHDVPPGWEYWSTCVEFGRGVLAQARGRWDEATDRLEPVVAALDEMGHRWDATVARIHLIEALRASGRSGAAAETEAIARIAAGEMRADRALGWLDGGSPQAAAG